MTVPATGNAADFERRKLRVGVTLPPHALYAWQAALLRRIIESDYASVVLLIVIDDGAQELDIVLDPVPIKGTLLSRRWVAWLLSLYRGLEAKIDCENDAFAPDEISELRLADIPRIHLPIRPQGEVQPLRAFVEAAMQFDLDVLIPLGPAVPDDFDGIARHGVWSLQHAHCDSGDVIAAGFWPVHDRSPAVESWLEVVNPARKGREIFYRSFSGTNLASVKLTRSVLYWKTSMLLTRGLRALQRDGGDFTSHGHTAEAEGASTALRSVMPTPAHLARHVARNVRRRLRDRLVRDWTLDNWILLFHLGPELATSIRDFTKIVPPRDRYWADPHVIRRGASYYVFIEEFIYSTRKGHLAVLTINDKGEHSEPIRILERDYHLSYPCVFEHDNETYMIPESSANRTVDLYRCVEFPARWELVRTLLDGVSAVDTTVLHDARGWWLFANVASHPGMSSCEELFVFHSESLFSSSWTPHECNPVVSDVRKSRPAGAIFRYKGKLYRPAQNCSVRYGYSMSINEITRLSLQDFEETELYSIEPDWARTIVATHTLAYVPGLTVIDAQEPRLRI